MPSFRCCVASSPQGRFRWATKAFKRWAFARGVQLTLFYSRQYAKKYLLKYLRKEAKASLGSLASWMQMAPRAHQKGSEQLAVEVSDILISGYSNRRPENEIRNDVVMAITAALTLDLGLTVGFIKSPPMQTPEILVSPMRFIRTKYEDRQISEFIDRFADYALGLGLAIDKNRGLDHSKVREYWLERGPRMFLTAVLFFAFTLVCQEIFRTGDKAGGDRAAGGGDISGTNSSVLGLSNSTQQKISNHQQARNNNIAVNTGAFVVAIILLYWRLPDSIKASISRTSHDYYVDSKRQFFGTCPVKKNQACPIAPLYSSPCPPYPPTSTQDCEMGASCTVGETSTICHARYLENSDDPPPLKLAPKKERDASTSRIKIVIDKGDLVVDVLHSPHSSPKKMQKVPTKSPEEGVGGKIREIPLVWPTQKPCFSIWMPRPLFREVGGRWRLTSLGSPDKRKAGGVGGGVSRSGRGGGLWMQKRAWNLKLVRGKHEVAEVHHNPYSSSKSSQRLPELKPVLKSPCGIALAEAHMEARGTFSKWAGDRRKVLGDWLLNRAWRFRHGSGGKGDPPRFPGEMRFSRRGESAGSLALYSRRVGALCHSAS